MRVRTSTLLNPSHSALLVIDVQNDLASEKGKYAELGYNIKLIRGVIKPLRNLISLARSAGVPIIYTKITYSRDYSDASPFTPSRSLNALKRKTWGSEIVQEVTPTEGDYVIDRQRASAFYQTPLEEILKSLKVDTLVLTGLTVSFGVESTARGAADRDFRVIIVEDCTASFTKEVYDAWLFITKQKQFWLWKVVNSNDVIKSLQAT